jgi:DNA-binding PadR family transcriptional regulator
MTIRRTRFDIPACLKVLLEEQGLVDTTREESTKGPGKCWYGLTDEGRTCLMKWAETLDAYQKSLVELVTMLRKAESSL